MKKCVFILLAVFIAVVLSACCRGCEICRTPETSFFPFVLNPNVAIADYILYPDGIRFQSDVDYAAILAERDAVFLIENDYFRVYIGDWNEVYFLDLRTNHLFSTNPAFIDFTEDERDEMFMIDDLIRRYQRELMDNILERRDMLGSRFELDVVDRNVRADQFVYNQFTFYSRWGFAFWEVGQMNRYDRYGNVSGYMPAVTITHDFGFGAPMPLSQITPMVFEYYSMRFCELLDLGKITPEQFELFRNSYRPVRYDDLPADAHEGDRRFFELLKYHNFYILDQPDRAALNELTLMNIILGCDQSIMDEEWWELGVLQSLGFSTFGSMPIVYILDGPNVLVQVYTSEIDYYGWGWSNLDWRRRLERINLHRTFAQQGDGVGVMAIIEHGAQWGGIAVEMLEHVPYVMTFPYINFDPHNHVQFTVRYVFLYDDWATPQGMQRFQGLYRERLRTR